MEPKLNPRCVLNEYRCGCVIVSEFPGKGGIITMEWCDAHKSVLVSRAISSEVIQPSKTVREQTESRKDGSAPRDFIGLVVASSRVLYMLKDGHNPTFEQMEKLETALWACSEEHKL